MIHRGQRAQVILSSGVLEPCRVNRRVSSEKEKEIWLVYLSLSKRVIRSTPCGWKKFKEVK